MLESTGFALIAEAEFAPVGSHLCRKPIIVDNQRGISLTTALLAYW